MRRPIAKCVLHEPKDSMAFYEVPPQENDLCGSTMSRCILRKKENESAREVKPYLIKAIKWWL